MSPFKVERLEDRCLLSANPANLEAAPVSDRQIELRWTTSPQPNPTGLWLQRAQGDSDFQTLTGILSTTTTYTDSNLTPSTTYRYRVWEQNPDGSSDYSNVASAAPNPPQLSREAIDLGRDPVVVSSNASPQVVIGGIGYMAALIPTQNVAQLWRTDGTDGGTTLLKAFSGAWSISQMTSVDGTLYFMVQGGNSNGIWKSDGTPDGTVFVTNAGQDQTSTYPYISRLIGFNGNLYFTAQSGPSTPLSLWRTDGTPAGTQVVNTFDTPPNVPDALAVADGKLFLNESDGGTAGLWVSDGTAAGTVPVFPPTTGNPTGMMQFYGAGGRLFFTANDGINANPGLWTSDGTAAGTVRLVAGSAIDLRAGLDGAMVGNEMYFLAYGVSTPTLHLWKSDGTVAGTQSVADLQQPVASVTYAGQYHIEVLGGRLLFATDVNSQVILWSSDGTAGGTTPILQIQLDPTYAVGITDLISFAGAVYFGAPAPGGSGALWRTNGTAAGTTQVVALAQPPRYFRQLGNLLTFLGYDPLHGYEFWASDGTDAGTHLVKNIAPDTTAPRRLTSLSSADGSLVFGTNNPGQSDTQEVWTSDGTQVGTVQLATGNLDFVGSAAGTWFFVGNAGLWASDHTPAGTKRIAPAPAGPLGIAGHNLFFDPSPSATVGPLWVTDGTTAGTMQIGSQMVYAYYGYYHTSGNYLYFLPSQPGTNGSPGLYRTDGTVAGTIKLANVTPKPQTMTDVNGTLFFVGSDPVNGLGLWRSDGTPQGTIFLQSFTSVTSIANANGMLYFSANNAAGEYGLWTSNGTPDGTRRVVPLSAEPPGTTLGSISGAGGIVYFLRNGNTELWRSDGTPQGTYLLHTGPVSQGYVSAMVPAGAKEYFRAGTSLWVTDGTLWGTRQIDLTSPVTIGLVAALNGMAYLGGLPVDASSSDNIRVVDTTAPAAPSRLVATSTPATGAAPGSVQLTWTDPAGNNDSGFVIERSLHPDFSTIDSNYYAPQGATAFTDNQVSGTPDYYYRVRAINAAGTSDATASASAAFVTISGSVFNDANYNAVRDAGEGPMASVTVFIDANGDGVLDPGEIRTTSGVDGRFMLGGLATGGYIVREVPPSGTRRTTWLPPDPLFATAGQGAGVPDFGNVATTAVHLDFAYLLTLAQHYGQSATTIVQGDLTGDEHVNFDDLLLLAQHYNGTLPAARPAAVRR